MSTEPTAFFQIAAALIPALLFAGALTQRDLASRVLSGRTSRDHIFLLVPVTVFVLFVLTGEVFAISGAIAAPETPPPAYQTTIVTETVALLAVATGVAILWPWYAASRIRLVRRVAFMGPILAFGSLAAVVAGAIVIENAVTSAQGRQDVATAFCIHNFQLNYELEQMNAQDRVSAIATALGGVRAEIRRAKRAPHIDHSLLARLSARKAGLQYRLTFANRYQLDVLKLFLPSDHANLDEIMAGFGC